MKVSTIIQPYGIKVFLLTNRKKYRKELLKKTGYKEDYAYKTNGVAHMLGNKKGELVVYVGWFNKDISTLVHECNHAILFLFDEYDLNAYDSMGEHFCYIQQKLFNDLYGTKAKK